MSSVEVSPAVLQGDSVLGAPIGSATSYPVQHESSVIGVGAAASVYQLRKSSPSHVLYPFLKRALDIMGSSLGLVALSPVFLVIALLVWRSSPGRVIFCQTRVGLNGKTFTCLKFRTMIEDADAYLAQYPDLLEMYTRSWKLDVDPRVTPIGRFLRKTSLDELPQLVNVLRGDMSLVGPRPYMSHELNGDFGAHAVHITRVRPGITGLWQISGRSTLLPHQRIDLDRQYADSATFGADVRILLRTVVAVVVTRGAM